MSPASKSKSKDKRAAAGKEPQKSSTKTTSTATANGGLPASGYNPLLGTFHTLDTAPISSAPPLNINSRSSSSRNIDDTKDHTMGTGTEYDSLSNNGSWSGESEDHKEKTSQGPSRHDTIPGVDNDKREKIRQKNEKKHQRQKERRAQELHERCSGYLMSRKLESLAQQLVAMGFSSERATMALILNEGRVEQSVAWLFEGNEDGENQTEHNNNLDGGGNLKIDISEELAQITEMEMKFKCSKQEVERAIVACEGDLVQAAETLKVQKQEPPPAVPPKLDESGDHGNTNNKGMNLNQNTLASRTQSKGISMPIQIQSKADDKDFNYTKMGVGVAVEPGVKMLKKIPPPATPTIEKRWPVGGSNPNPSVSYSLASPLQAAPPPAKTESRYSTVGTELKNLQLGSVREPVIVMQRPKSKQIPAGVDWHPNAVDPIMNMNPNVNGFSHVPSTASRSFNGSSSYGSTPHVYDQFHYQQQQQAQAQAIPHPHAQHHFSQQGGSMNHFNNGNGGGNIGGNGGMWNRMTPTLAAASSLGLFSGSSGPSSPVDWNAGDSSQFDYTNIDWSLDRVSSSSTSRGNNMWLGWGASSVSVNGNVNVNGGGGGKSGMRAAGGGLAEGGGGEASGSGSREWSSPFEEKELFSFPSQFVSSPSL